MVVARVEDASRHGLRHRLHTDDVCVGGVVDHAEPYPEQQCQQLAYWGTAPGQHPAMTK